MRARAGRVRIQEELLTQMTEHANSLPEEEVCGLVYPDRYVRLTNRAGERQFQFLADAKELAHALALYGEPAAVFHTHPKGPLAPSQTDLERNYYKNSTIIIGRIQDGSLRFQLFDMGKTTETPRHREKKR